MGNASLQEAFDVQDGKDSKDKKRKGDSKEKEAKEEKDTKVTKEVTASGASSSPAAPGASSASTTATGAAALAGLGNIAELHKKVAEEKNKLRLFVIKAKQDWEERQERGVARGETNDENYYMASTGEVLGPSGEYRAGQCWPRRLLQCLPLSRCSTQCRDKSVRRLEICAIQSHDEESC